MRRYQVVLSLIVGLTPGLALSEQAAQLQLLAQSIGAIRTLAPELAREAHDFLLKDGVVNATFAYWARQIVRKYPETLSAGPIRA